MLLLFTEITGLVNGRLYGMILLGEARFGGQFLGFLWVILMLFTR
jgi:hypothetical protein